mmetsp:Transcript_6791/g.24734  ORF Transcript_6791/g.24734 Transcript_6791/m.24734 type:complete len:226 (+) Transcript_6791:877-1554(+)
MHAELRVQQVRLDACANQSVKQRQCHTREFSLARNHRRWQLFVVSNQNELLTAVRQGHERHRLGDLTRFVEHDCAEIDTIQKVASRPRARGAHGLRISNGTKLRLVCFMFCRPGRNGVFNLITRQVRSHRLGSSQTNDLHARLCQTFHHVIHRGVGVRRTQHRTMADFQHTAHDSHGRVRLPRPWWTLDERQASLERRLHRVALRVVQVVHSSNIIDDTIVRTRQ